MSRHNNYRGAAAKHNFSIAPQPGIPRTRFDRSFTHKTCFDAGMLIPFFIDEVLPGDTFKANLTGFARIATLLFPIMDTLKMDVHWFFTPSRILWENWEAFNGANIPDTDSSTDYILPTVTSPTGGFLADTIFDYMGLPIVNSSNITVNSLPLRGYSQIYNDWYRDENFNNMVTVPTGDGPDNPDLFTLLARNKRYDYFTSCLPFPQKGTAVEIPLIGDAPVVRVGGLGVGSTWEAYGAAGNTPFGNSVAIGTNSASKVVDAASGTGLNFDPMGSLEADLSGVAATTINALRLAATTQQMYEIDARGGTRYQEVIMAHFKVFAQDARLQRSEFLSGHSQTVRISAVPQTSATGITGSDNPQANLAAFGTVLVEDAGFTHSFPEHGYVYGILSVRADYTYWQGAERFWFRSARFDFYWPTFAHIGEQAVLNQEIYTTGTSTDAIKASGTTIDISLLD